MGVVYLMFCVIGVLLLLALICGGIGLYITHKHDKEQEKNRQDRLDQMSNLLKNEIMMNKVGWIDVTKSLPTKEGVYTVRTKSILPSSTYTNTLKAELTFDKDGKAKWSVNNQIVTHYLLIE